MSGEGAQRKTQEKDLEVKGREKIEDPGKEIRHEHEDVARYGCCRHEHFCVLSICLGGRSDFIHHSLAGA